MAGFVELRGEKMSLAWVNVLEPYGLALIGGAVTIATAWITHRAVSKARVESRLKRGYPPLTAAGVDPEGETTPIKTDSSGEPVTRKVPAKDLESAAMRRWEQLTDRIDKSMEQERRRNDKRAGAWAQRISELEMEIEETRMALRECERREVRTSARFDRMEAVMSALLAILETKQIEVPGRLMDLAVGSSREDDHNGGG
jgi:hypothetical protein